VEDREDSLPRVKLNHLSGTEVIEAVGELLRSWDKVGRSTRRLRLGMVEYDHPHLDKTTVFYISPVEDRRGVIPAENQRR